MQKYPLTIASVIIMIATDSVARAADKKNNKETNMFKMFLSKALGAIRIVLIPAAVAGTACFAGTLSSAPKQADNHQMAAGKPPAVSTDTKLAAGKPPGVSTSAAAANV